MTALAEFSGKKLLITGGTGSFGNAVLRRFINSDLKQIRILSRDEKKQDDMRHQFTDEKIKYYIGDVRTKSCLEDACEGVDYIFHAAALKQVPSCEFYPMEAVRTNAIGTDNVLTAAIRAGVKNVVVLSTDKAAYPINAMGMSKAIMEKIAIARSGVAAEKGTTISVTRYGNVMASRGSVIPLFVNQLFNGKQLTVTDPEMTRFMMSLDDAVDLVIYAFLNAAAGDLFVQKAPAATIKILVEAIGQVFKLPVSMKCIGTRHGEKLFETLLTREEMVRAEDVGDYFRVGADVRGLNYDKYFSAGKNELSSEVDYHSHNAHRLSVDEMAELLHQLPFIQNMLNEVSQGQITESSDSSQVVKRLAA
jgi:UDP-glucose 4-epimerase